MTHTYKVTCIPSFRNVFRAIVWEDGKRLWKCDYSSRALAERAALSMIALRAERPS